MCEIVRTGTTLTIADEASGSPTPTPTNLFWLKNGDFLIKRTGKPPTGDGAGEATSWRFEFCPEELDSLQRASELDRAVLKLTLVQEGRNPRLGIQGFEEDFLIAGVVPQKPSSVQTVTIDLSSLTDTASKTLTLATLRQELLSLGHLSCRLHDEMLVHRAELQLMFLGATEQPK